MPVSSAIRSASERAAIRRGWVCPIMPRTPRPNFRQIFGSWVDFPDPVSPATMTTWFASMAAIRSSTLALTGSSIGKVMVPISGPAASDPSLGLGDLPGQVGQRRGPALDRP